MPSQTKWRSSFAFSFWEKFLFKAKKKTVDRNVRSMLLRSEIKCCFLIMEQNFLILFVLKIRSLFELKCYLSI